MRRVGMGVMTVFLLAGRVALAGEENRSPELRDLRQAARQEFAGLAAEPPQGEEKRQFERVRRILDVLARDGISLAEVLGRDDAQATVARQGISRVFTAARRTAANPLADMADRVSRCGDSRSRTGPAGRRPALAGQPADSADALGTTTRGRRGDEPFAPQPRLRTPAVRLDETRPQGPRRRSGRPAVARTVAGCLGGGIGTAVPSWPRHWIGHAVTSRCVIPQRRSACVRRSCECTPAAKPEIRKSLDKFFPALSMQGDAVRGKKVFTEATCANCHKVEDVGRHVGPDLSRLVDRSPRTLLVDTIDPNRVVDHRFIEYTAVTTNGLQISGMLFDETEDSITLADLKGELHVVLRKDLDELVSHHRSQMPEGLEAKLHSATDGRLDRLPGQDRPRRASVASTQNPRAVPCRSTTRSTTTWRTTRPRNCRSPAMSINPTWACFWKSRPSGRSW